MAINTFHPTASYYQIAAVRTDIAFCYFNYFTKPIRTFKLAIRTLDHLRSELKTRGHNCSIVFKHTFTAELNNKTVVYHLYKIDRRHPAQPLTDISEYPTDLTPSLVTAAYNTAHTELSDLLSE